MPIARVAFILFSSQDSVPIGKFYNKVINNS